MRILVVVFLLSAILQSNAQTNTRNTDGILWFGIDNPLTIEDTTLNYPLLKSSDITAVKESNRVFIVNVINPKSRGNTIEIDLYDSTTSGIKKMSSYNFLVKRLPDPVFLIAGKLVHDTISRTDLLRTKTINVALDDADFTFKAVPFELQSFDMEIDGKEFHSNSNRLTNSMILMLSNTKGNKVRIRNDKVILATSNSDRIARCVAPRCDKTFILAK